MLANHTLLSGTSENESYIGKMGRKGPEAFINLDDVVVTGAAAPLAQVSILINLW